MAEVALKSKLWWEFGKPLTRIHFDPVVSTAAGVGWLESSMVDGAVECHELINAVADPFQRPT